MQCHSRKLGLTLTLISSFAPHRSATQCFFNASFWYVIFDLVVFLCLRLEVSLLNDSLELEMLSKWCFVLVGNVLVNGDVFPSPL